MLKAIAIDDEPIALEVIKSLVAHVGFIQVEAYFTNSFKAMEHMQQHQTDLIFLDIKMPNISGVDFLKSIKNPPMVIFTTAYSEHAVQSFEVDAIDYLLKPFSLPRFLKACNKVHEQYKLRANKDLPTTSRSIFIKSGYEQVRVELADILYAESVGNYIQFNLASGTVVSRLTMAEAAELLPEKDFIRIHRSFIIALNYVSAYSASHIDIGTNQLPIGGSYADALQKKLRLG